MSRGRSDRKDPAESRGYLRYFYRNWRPTRLGRLWSRAYAFVAAMGVLPPVLTTLQVRDRETGKPTSTVLVIASHRGDRYIVSMLGNESDWVRNLRAAKGQATLTRGSAEPVQLIELPPKERAPILKAWCEVATSGRRHLPISPDAPLGAFAAIATDYPVFRVEPR